MLLLPVLNLLAATLNTAVAVPPEPAKFAVPNPKTQTVLIRADRLVKYKDFMAVVNQLQTDGYYKVALINENLGAG